VADTPPPAFAKKRRAFLKKRRAFLKKRRAFLKKRRAFFQKPGTPFLVSVKNLVQTDLVTAPASPHKGRDGGCNYAFHLKGIGVVVSISEAMPVT
jgi:hypothetical protein